MAVGYWEVVKSLVKTVAVGIKRYKWEEYKSD